MDHSVWAHIERLPTEKLKLIMQKPEEYDADTLAAVRDALSRREDDQTNLSLRGRSPWQ